MAPSFDCSVSSLLCAEEGGSVFDDNDYNGVVAESETIAQCHWNHRNINNKLPFDGGDGLPLQSEACVSSMIEKECQHMPSVHYLRRLQNGDLDLGARKEAIDWIGKVQAHYDFGPLCAYLAINYLDRFLSSYELPKGKPWMMQLLAVACLSLAAKLDETEVPLSLDLQMGDAKYIFEARTIQRMELLVLHNLKWRMQAVTPYSFIDYFLRKINDDQTQLRILILRAVQLISCTIKGIEFLEFKPSEVAAAVAIAVGGEILTIDNDKAISALTQCIEKERVLKCVELIIESSLNDGLVKGAGGSLPSVPQSPIGVLDAAACLSYRSDDTTAGSCVNSSQNSPVAKRRKMDRPCELELQK
ncbi:cyclin-D3-1-like [Tripterygium wilfordii]|uniref:B-like cyclin n=1 Tax=Tripterygium wilfordii TaxID=458696 RepID=A0A7J7D1E3_TRIWF|nr:cyclin-D4-1-like [Tripterygium wilfordii]KAF5740167.1 cyclin-D3-1-like [Tripterygium wilfordii]